MATMLDLTQNKYSSQWRRDNFGPKRYEGKWKVEPSASLKSTSETDLEFFAPFGLSGHSSEQEAKQAKQKIVDYFKQEINRLAASHEKEIQKTNVPEKRREIVKKMESIRADLESDIKAIQAAKVVPE